MASEHGGSAGLNTSTVPLADGGAEDRAAEGKQSSERSERNIIPESIENTGFCPVLWYHFLMGNEKNTAASTPEMVTISRAEYEELKLQNQWLLEQLGLARKRQFGASSERLQEGLMDQLSLMANEAEAYAYGTKNATAEQVAVKAHARKRHSGNVLDIVPEGTPTEVVEHRLSEEERTCDACGSVMAEIGKEVRRSLKMEPARF